MNWFSILRLGLVQLCIGSSVVIPIYTLNRLMKVELALPATIAGFLIALHYAVQLTRVNWGYLSDKTQNRSQWIIFGMLILGIGGVLASVSIPLIESNFAYGIMLALFSYTLIGFGVGAAGTPLLALLASYSSKSQKGFAASITFLMMILGLAITGITAGIMLDPYSHQKLIKITATLAIITNILSYLSLKNLEKSLQIMQILAYQILLGMPYHFLQVSKKSGWKEKLGFSQFSFLFLWAPFQCKIQYWNLSLEKSSALRLESLQN